MKNFDFDERQKLVRGNACTAGYIFLMVYILFDMFLRDFGIIWASTFNGALIGLYISFLIVLTIMTLNDVYVGHPRMNIIFGIMSACAVVMFVLNLRHISEPLFEGGMLTDTFRGWVTCICSVLISLFYWFRLYKSRRLNEN